MRKLIAFFLAALLLCSCSTVEKTYKVTVEVSDIEGSWEARASYLASESDIEAAQEDESGWKTVEPAGSAFTLSGLKNGLWLVEVRCQAESGEEYYSYASVRVKGANTSVSLLFSIDDSESSGDLVSDDSGDSEDSTSDSSGSSSESSDDVVSDDSGDSEDSSSDSSGSSSESLDDIVSDDSGDGEDSSSDSSESSSESSDDVVSDDSGDSEDSSSDSGSSSESLDDLVPESLDDSDDSSSDSSDDSSDSSGSSSSSSGSSSGSSSSSSSDSNRTLFVTVVTWSQKMSVSRVGSADSWVFTLTDYSAESSKTWYVNSSEVTEDGYTGSLSGVTAELSDDSLQLTVSLSSEFSDNGISYILVSCAEDGSYSHYLEIAITD